MSEQDIVRRIQRETLAILSCIGDDRFILHCCGGIETALDDQSNSVRALTKHLRDIALDQTND